MGAFRTRSDGGGNGESFSPTKANLFQAVKAIFHPSTNAGVSADDANKELDVSASSGGAGDPNLEQVWSQNISLAAANRLTRSQTSQATLRRPGSGEIYAAHVVDGSKRSPLGMFLAADLEAVSAADGDTPSESNSIEMLIGDQRVGYLSKDSQRRPLFAANDANVDPMPLTISRLRAPAAADGTGSFSPSKANLYEAVKAIFHPADNGGVSADDANSELDVAANPSVPAKATNADVDSETEDAKFATVAKVFRAIARRVKNASATVRGIVLLARNEDVDASETDTSRVPTVALAKRLLERLVPAVFRAGNTDRIPLDKLPDLDDSLIEKLYDDEVAANAAAFTVDGAAVENDANDAYYIRVGTATEFQLGNALFAATSSSPIAVDGVRFWTLSDGSLRIGATSAAKQVVVWKVDDLAAIRATVRQAAPQAAAWAREGNTDDVPDDKIPDEIARDSEVADSVTGLSFASRTLTGTRRSGANPIEVDLSGLASDAGVPLGSLRSVGFWHPAADAANGNFLPTGITLPSAPADEAVFLLTSRWGGQTAGYLAINGSITGADIKALPTVAAGDNSGGTGFLVESIGDTEIYGGKLASGELLLRNDEGTWDASYDYFAVYEVLDAAAAGRITNPAKTVIAGVNSGNRVNVTAGRLNPENPRVDTSDSNRMPAPIQDIGILAAGAVLGDGVSDLSESDDTVTLEPGVWIAVLMIGVYTDQVVDTLYSANNRGNTYHDAVMDIGGSETVISDQMSESYVRPVSDPDDNYGGFHRAIILRVPRKGAVKFRHAISGQSAGMYLGCRRITLYRMLGPAPAASDPKPSISLFALTGDLSPAAGAINETYDYAFAVAQSSHLSALRIVRFSGTAAAPAAVTVLVNIAAADFHGGSGQITVTGFSLAADAVETVRLEGYGQGQNPATDQPATYHDARIAAHAPASAAVRFIRVPRTFGTPAARPTAATLAAALAETGAGVMSTSSTVVGDWDVSGIPATGDWLVGWIVAQNIAQPSHYTQAGIQIDVAVAARFAFTENGEDYYVYLFADTNYVDSTYNGSTITVT